MSRASRMVVFFVATLSTLAFTLATSQEQPVEKITQVLKADAKKEQGDSKGYETKDAKKSLPPQVPAVIAKAPTDIEKPIPYTKSNGEKKDEGWWAKLFADPVAFFTCLLFVATFALWWATRRLVVGAEQSSKQQLRAYISSRPDFIFGFSPTQLACMRYTIENHGQTPAYSVRHIAKVDILPFPLPSDFKFPTLPPFAPASLSLHPRESILGNVTAQRLFTAQEISNAAGNNGCRIYCFGIISYESFGSIRTTKFCRSIVGSSNLLAVGSGGTKDLVCLDYDITGQHNEAS